MYHFKFSPLFCRHKLAVCQLFFVTIQPEEVGYGAKVSPLDHAVYNSRVRVKAPCLLVLIANPFHGLLDEDDDDAEIFTVMIRAAPSGLKIVRQQAVSSAAFVFYIGA